MSHFGLDIGSRSVKAVQMDKSGGAWRLRTAGVVGFPRPVTMATEQETTQVAEVVKKLVADIKVSTKDVVVSLPEAQVFTRLIKLPPLTDQEVASSIKWEAEQYIPIPIAEAVVQHKIVGRRQPGQSSEQQGAAGVDVLLIAAPKSLVEKYVKLAQVAGLNVVGVETELLSLSRSLAPAEGSVLIVDFGASSTDLAVARGGELVFSRSIPTAGEAFTRAVAQGLGVEEMRAEEYKRTYGMSAAQLEGKVRDVLKPVFNVVVEEMGKAIHFYKTELQGQSPSMVVLSGGTTGMPEIVTEFTKALGVEVTIGDPFQGVSVDPNLAKGLVGYGPLYAIASGLARWEE